MEHLRISHFRGIQQGELRGFQKLNLLMGPNNSGKSAVLEALYLLGSTDWNSRDNLLTWLQEGLDPRIWGDFYVPLRFYWPSQTEETLLA